VKITIKAGLYRDKPLLMDMFDTATKIFGQHAKDANLDDRLKEQFVRQRDRGLALTQQLWRQKGPHEIVFVLEEDETDRWLLLNMMTTAIDVMTHVVTDIQNLTARTLYTRRITRANEIHDMIEDAAERH
jgi:hypothetical protein